MDSWDQSEVSPGASAARAEPVRQASHCFHHLVVFVILASYFGMQKEFQFPLKIQSTLGLSQNIHLPSSSSLIEETRGPSGTHMGPRPAVLKAQECQW